MTLPLLLLACNTPPPPAPTQPAAVEAGLRLQAPEAVFSEDGLTVDQQRWSWSSDDGLEALELLCWRAHTTLPGRVQVLPSDTVRPLAQLTPADTPTPWAAINGGFYDKGPMGLVVSAGQEHASLRAGGGSGVFFFGPAGPGIVHRDAWQAGPSEALQSIDRLVDAGASLVRTTGDRSTARSAVALSKTELWLVACSTEASVNRLEDGRLQLVAAEATGPRLSLFADYLIQALGAVTALNLDGGISTQIRAQGAEQSLDVLGQSGTINGILLQPSP